MKKKNLFSVKFIAVALAVGVFSPTISVENMTSSEEGYKVNISILQTAEARQRSKNVKRSGNRSSNRNRNTNRNRNVNRNVNVNTGGGRYYGGGSYNNHNTGAAVVAGMVVGAAVASTANQ